MPDHQMPDRQVDTTMVTVSMGLPRTVRADPPGTLPGRAPGRPIAL
ncbi:MAG: hypothetical protein RL375_1562, partial [Pseudomonadota bacterium]